MPRLQTDSPKCSRDSGGSLGCRGLGVSGSTAGTKADFRRFKFQLRHGPEVRALNHRSLILWGFGP